MTCDVGKYLPMGDFPVDEVERIVHLRMRAQQGRRRGRGRAHRAFLPPQSIEFVVTTQNGDTLHLTGYYLPDAEQCYLDLHHGRAVLRKFHGHEGHRNPNGFGNSVAYLHMHFPSRKYPLVEYKSSYAYALDGDRFGDVADYLSFFCAALDIDLNEWQSYLTESQRGLP